MLESFLGVVGSENLGWLPESALPDGAGTHRAQDRGTGALLSPRET